MLALTVRAQMLASRLKNRLRGEAGQTSSEYVIIAGIAVVIIIAILAIFKDQLLSAANSIMGKVTTEVNK